MLHPGQVLRGSLPLLSPDIYIYIPLASGTISDTHVIQITSRLTYVLRPLLSRRKNDGTYHITQ